MAMEIIPFNFEGRTVRIVDQEGNPWWVAKDVCECLGLTNVSEVMNRLDADECDTLTLSLTEGHSAGRGVISLNNEEI